jgi:hypothetical protein
MPISALIVNDEKNGREKIKDQFKRCWPPNERGTHPDDERKIWRQLFIQTDRPY